MSESTAASELANRSTWLRVSGLCLRPAVNIFQMINGLNYKRDPDAMKGPFVNVISAHMVGFQK